jgi:hypothetical protein
MLNLTTYGSVPRASLRGGGQVVSGDIVAGERSRWVRLLAYKLWPIANSPKSKKPEEKVLVLKCFRITYVCQRSVGDQQVNIFGGIYTPFHDGPSEKFTARVGLTFLFPE